MTSGSENEKKAITLIDQLIKDVQTIDSWHRAANSSYFYFIRSYIIGLISAGKNDGTLYVADCDEMDKILSHDTYYGVPFPIEVKILKTLNFLKAKILSDSIEDLIVEWDRHTMYDISTIKPKI